MKNFSGIYEKNLLERLAFLFGWQVCFAWKAPARFPLFHPEPPRRLERARGFLGHLRQG
jgi:hypothetical protein